MSFHITGGLEADRELEARVDAGVLEWLREDAPLVVKMSLYPEEVDTLIARIVAALRK